MYNTLFNFLIDDNIPDIIKIGFIVKYFGGKKI